MASVRVLTDSGAVISCISGTWVKALGLLTIKGESISIIGVTQGKLRTSDYVVLNAAPLSKKYP